MRKCEVCKKEKGDITGIEWELSISAFCWQSETPVIPGDTDTQISLRTVYMCSECFYRTLSYDFTTSEYLAQFVKDHIKPGK